MSCESYDLRLTTLSPIHIGSGKSYNCCEFVPAKAKSKGQIVKIIKRVNLTNYYSSLSDDRKDTFLASLTNSNFELKQFDKKIKKDFVRYQCIDNSRVDFINEVQEHIKTSDKLYIPGSSIKGAIRTAIFYNLLTEEDMDKIGKDISSNRRINSLSDGLLKKYFTSGFGNNDAQYNIFRFMQVADTTTTNLPRIEQVLAVMATDDRRKNQFYSRHGKVVKSYLETIGANKNLDELCHSLFKYYFIDFIPFCDDDFIDSDIGEIPKEWSITTVGNILDCKLGGTPSRSNESYWGGSIAWINSGKVNDFRIIEPSEYITEKGLKKSATKLLPAKTTVIAITGATLGQISLLEIDSCVNQSVIGIIPNINYPYEFVYPLISSILIDLLKHQTGGAQQHINKNNVESFKIICPPAEIISEYKTIVSPIYSKISDNCFEIEKLQKLRDTLLPKLMSGEIDVSKINCDLELKYNYMKYLFNQIHTPMSKSVV